VISPYSQTEIRDAIVRPVRCLCVLAAFHSSGRLMTGVGRISSDQECGRRLWKTANIFSRSGNDLVIATLFLIAFDIALVVNLPTWKF